jgi:hypothetical protein
VRRRRDAVDLTIAAEFGSDLALWSTVLQPVGAPIDHGDGSETVTYEDPAPSAGQRFGRLRVTLTPP